MPDTIKEKEPEAMDRAKELLKYSLEEIRTLRKQNELMDARLSMFDAVMSALHGQPAHRGYAMMHPDVVFEIERFLESNQK